MRGVSTIVWRKPIRRMNGGCVIAALLVCGLITGCGEKTDLSTRAEAAQPPAAAVKPAATAVKPASANEKPAPAETASTAAKSSVAEQLRAEVQSFLVPYVGGDAARAFGGSRVAHQRWPTKEEKVLAYYRSVKMLAQAAAETGLAEGGEVSEIVRGMMLAEYRWRLFEKLMGKIAVTEKEIEEFYRQNIAQYRTKGQFTIRHIFLNVVENPDKKEEKAARAKEAMAQLRAGKPFQKVAEEYSDVEGEKGTVLAPLPFGEINSTLQEAIVAVKPGQVTDIIETRWGYNIFRLEKIEHPTTKPLESVRASIERNLRTQKTKDAQDRFVQELEKRYPVRERNDHLLEDPDVSNDSILVRSDFVTIKLGEFRKRMLELPETSRLRTGRPEDRRAFLDGWIGRERIAYAAGKHGVQSDPAVRAIGRYFTDRTVANMYLTQLLERVPESTDEEIRKYYETNRKQLYTKPGEVRLREIVISLPTASTASKYEQYKAWKATQDIKDDVVRKLKEGADFVDLVKQYSVSTSKAKDGDMGFVVPARISSTLAAAVGKLQVGEVSDPIEDRETRAYTIVRLEERRPGDVRPLDDQLSENIAGVIRAQKQRDEAVRIRIALAEGHRKGMTRDEIVEILER